MQTYKGAGIGERKVSFNKTKLNDTRKQRKPKTIHDGLKDKVATSDLKQSATKAKYKSMRYRRNKNQKHTQERYEETLEMT